MFRLGAIQRAALLRAGELPPDDAGEPVHGLTGSDEAGSGGDD